MNLLGIDIGSSSIKVALFNAETGQSIARVNFPSREMEIDALQPGWAEQDPDEWMSNLIKAIELLKAEHHKELKAVSAIGITYQMHGLVAVNVDGNPIRKAIIWCDSRAVGLGEEAFNTLGKPYCLKHLLNSPGNFTASKLAWIKAHEPRKFDEIYKIMLPGDYIAYKLTGDIRTTSSGLSEGIFWDFQKNDISKAILTHYGFDADLLPEVSETFAVQGHLSSNMANLLGMQSGIPVSYRAGDQPNNAFSLSVLHPGEVAATAGTSGVVYGVTDKKDFDPRSRVNTFLHVNNTQHQNRLGILLCLNSIGILNSWTKNQLLVGNVSYEEMNKIAGHAPEGSSGLIILPFGNGAERVLENKNPGASIHGLHLTIHNRSHILRAMQEGIAFAFYYGVEIMEKMGLDLRVIRAGYANMFMSPLFTQTLSNVSNAKIELYNTDGAEGAARGAAVGTGYFNSPEEAFNGLKVLQTVEPDLNSQIGEFYAHWKNTLHNSIETNVKQEK